MRHLIFLAGLVPWLVFPAPAYSGDVEHADVEQARRLVIETGERVLAALRAEKERMQKEPGYVHDLVDRIVLPHFDFERIARWVLGKYVRKASPEQLQRFTREFRTLLVRTYASALNEYTDQKIDYPPLRARPGSREVTVHSEVSQPGAFPIPIDYDLYLKDGEWKVYDVKVDGVSLVANYRSGFYRQIRQKGLEALIENLSRRNREASS